MCHCFRARLKHSAQTARKLRLRTWHRSVQQHGATLWRVAWGRQGGQAWQDSMACVAICSKWLPGESERASNANTPDDTPRCFQDFRHTTGMSHVAVEPAPHTPHSHVCAAGWCPTICLCRPSSRPSRKRRSQLDCPSLKAAPTLMPKKNHLPLPVFSL